MHIRYEDKHSIKNKIISFGMYLNEFKAETVDANGKPNFMNADEKIIYKIGNLTGFNVYWNCINDLSLNNLISTRQEFTKDTTKEYVWKLLKDSINSGQLFETKFSTFMNNNLDLNTRLTLRRSYQKEELQLPKITFQSSVSAIEFIFLRVQYKSILEIIDYYSMLNINKKYVK